GSPVRTQRLGSPGLSDSRRFPIDSVDRWEWLLLSGLKKFTGNYVHLLNGFYLLTFIMPTISAFIAFRLMGLSRLSTVSASLLFAFQPYHWFQSIGHLFLSSYFMVPMLGLMTLWIARSDENDHIFCVSKTDKPFHQIRSIRELFQVRFRPFNYRAAIVIISAVIASGTGSMYYLLMAMVLWFFVGFWQIFRSGKAGHFFDLVFLETISLACCIIQLLPSLYYLWLNHIPAIKRSADHVSGSSLDLFWLFLPSIGHRSLFLRKFVTFGQYYNHPSDHIVYPLSEKCFTSLGMIGAAGLSLILICTWLNLNFSRRLLVIKSIGSITIIGIIISTTNGVNRLFAYIPGFPVRAWCRFSIFLAFFSLFVAFVFMDEINDQLSKRFSKHNRIFSVFIVLITLFGLWDQSPSIWIPAHQESRKLWLEDTEFISKIESVESTDSMIFNLPITGYPEGIGYNRSHLLSKKLKWSFGAYRESGYMSDPAKWQDELLKLPPEEMVRELARKGFAGILVEDDPLRDRIKEFFSQNSINLLDYELRMRHQNMKELESLELKLKHAGLKLFSVNSRGDWRYYRIPS
ncbi:MAG: hypothetical protein ACKO0V_11735, partial [bacterium]